VECRGLSLGNTTHGDSAPAQPPRLAGSDHAVTLVTPFAPTTLVTPAGLARAQTAIAPTPTIAIATSNQ